MYLRPISTAKLVIIQQFIVKESAFFSLHGLKLGSPQEITNKGNNIAVGQNISCHS